MKYVLDTDILVYFLNGHQNVIEKISVVPGVNLSTTIFNQAELFYGAFNSKKIEKNKQKVEAFIKDICVLEFTDAASIVFAELKATLKKQGKILEDMDLMIASIALVNHSILVTNNTKHFERIKHLKLENWSV